MPNFSLTDAAFEGFRFTRERPASVAAWAGATFLFNLASGVLGGLLGGDAMRAVQALGGHPTLADIIATFPPAIPPLLMTFLVDFAGAAIIYASAMRSFIGIDKKITFHLGVDEIRLFVILVIYFMIYIFLNVLIGVSFGILGNVGMVFGDIFPVVVGVTTPVALICIPGFVLVRLLLTPVIAIDRKRIDFRESWRSTNGHFWPLALSLLISLILFAIVGFVALMIVMILAELVSIGSGGAIATPGQIFNPDEGPATLPAIILGGIFFSVIIGIFLPVVLGPQVRAYQAYDAPDPVNAITARV